MIVGLREDAEGIAARRCVGEDVDVVEVVAARARMIQSATRTRESPAAAPRGEAGTLPLPPGRPRGRPGARISARNARAPAAFRRTGTVRAVDRVVIEGLIVLAHVGVSDSERAATQRCRVDIDLRADLRAAGSGDDLAQTIDYGAVVETVRSVAAAAAPKLLETLAEKMAAALLDRFCGGGAGAAASSVRLRLVKLAPPLDVPVAGVGVEIERERGSGGSLRERGGFR